MPPSSKYNEALLKYQLAAIILGGDGTSALPGFVNIDHADTGLVMAYQFALYNAFNPTADLYAYWWSGLDATARAQAAPLLAQAQNAVASSTDFSETYSRLRYPY